MNLQLHIMLGLTLLSAVPVRAQQQKQPPIVGALRALFDAAAVDDVAKFDSIVSPNFYLFEGGRRFNGDAMMSLIKGLHAQGKRYTWSVTEPDVHVDGNSAWIAYVNRGTETDSSGTRDVTWLESADLRKLAGVWRIEFMQSTRVPASQ